jgi:hypothetical protein
LSTHPALTGPPAPGDRHAHLQHFQLQEDDLFQVRDTTQTGTSRGISRGELPSATLLTLSNQTSQNSMAAACLTITSEPFDASVLGGVPRRALLQTLSITPQGNSCNSMRACLDRHC